MASKIEIYRAVAVAIGERAPSDENESTDFIRAISPLWDSIVADYATRHAWSWGTQTREITSTANTLPAKWSYSYALPVDRTLVRDVRESTGVPVDYDIQGQRIYSNSVGPLELTINVLELEAYWPGDFAACVRQTLEGHMWKGLRDDFARGMELINQIDPPEGEGKLKSAIRRDKRQKPPLTAMRSTIYAAFKNALTQRRARNDG